MLVVLIKIHLTCYFFNTSRLQGKKLTFLGFNDIRNYQIYFILFGKDDKNGLQDS